MTARGNEGNICDHVRQRADAMERELEAHVAIPTGTGHRPGLDAYRDILVDRLAALGANIELVPGDPRPWWLDSSGRSREVIDCSAAHEPPPPVVIARKTVTTSTPRVLVAGHLDTVHDPDGPFREMRRDASGVTATGPGVVDMKGGILIALHALEALDELGIELNWTFLLNSEEETGSFQSARILCAQAAAHDLGIAVEPALADGSLAIERMGSGQFMVEVFGRSAHVGREFEKGVSAVACLAEVILKLASFAQPAEGRIVNVGPLKGGAVTNAVPEYAACWGNVRYRDLHAGDALARMIDALSTDEHAMPRIVVHRQWNRPAKPLTSAVEKLAAAAQKAATDLGQALPLASTGGVCDGNILQDAGLPTLDTLGVRGGNLHRPDEFIELASLVERCQLLAILLSRIARGEIEISHNPAQD